MTINQIFLIRIGSVFLPVNLSRRLRVQDDHQGNYVPELVIKSFHLPAKPATQYATFLTVKHFKRFTGKLLLIRALPGNSLLN